MKGTSWRCLKICCLITSIIILLLVVTLVVLIFTVFKQKQPKFTTTSATVEHLVIGFPMLALDLTLGIDADVTNPNYAGFEYKNTTTSIYYRSVLVGQAPLDAGTIHARSTTSVSSSVHVIADKVIFNPNFLPDVFSGSLNFTSYTSVEGRAILFGIVKFHASAITSCDITIFVVNKTAASACDSKFKI